MTKTDKIIEDYEEAYRKLHGKNPEIVRKGSWIYIDKSFTAHRISTLPVMAESLIKRKKERDRIASLVPIDADTEYTIRKLLSAIKVDGKHIFRSTNIKDMQKAGKRIAKMASRALNLIEVGGE